MNITVLHNGGANFCKSFRYDGPTLKSCSADLRTYYGAESYEVGSLEELSNLLLKLEDDPTRLIIRGHATDGVDLTKPVRRKVANCLMEPQEAPFCDKPISWLMVDIDKYPLPKNIDLLTRPQQAVEHVVQQLPKEFKSSSYHYQLSGSAGVNYTDRISVHLVFWLEEAATSAQVRSWAKAVNSSKRLIDESLYNPVQPHYTAKPHFPSGFKDPFDGLRSGLVKKPRPAVRLDYSIIKKAQKIRQHHPQREFEGVSGYENILAELGDGIGGQRFHKPLLRSVASHVAIVGREQAEVTREWLKADLRARIDAADQTNHSYEDIERHKSDAALDGLIDSAIAKFGDSKSFPAHFDVVELPVEEAEEKLNNAIDDFSQRVHEYWANGWKNLDEPPCLAIKATAGLGKTSKLIARLIRYNALERGDIHYFVPTHKLSAQLVTDLDQALDVEGASFILKKTQLIAGRDKTDEDGKTLCEKAPLANQVAKLGLDVSAALCKNGKKVCQFYRTCGYQKQFGDKDTEAAAEAQISEFNRLYSEVKVMAHNHLFLNTKDRMRAPKLVIVDEAFWQTGIDETLIPPTDLLTVQKPISSLICQTLVNPDAPPLLKVLRDAEYDQSHLRNEAEVIEKAASVKLGIKPDMTTSEQSKRLSASAYIVKAHILLKHLSAELARVSRDESHVVRFEPQSNDRNPRSGQLVLTTRKHLNVDAATPIIFIDANAQKEILEQFVESVEVVEIAAQRKATIHQFTDRSFSKTKLLSPDGELLSQVQAFIAGVASKGATLVACTKAVKTAICGDGDAYEGASFVNYGNLRGLNDYASFDNVIILGREQPAASGMSDQARAMWWDSEEPLRGLQDKSGNLPYVSQPRGYRGIQRGSVQVQTHPDWRAQLLLEQVREAESEQALDRLRLLRGEGKQRQVYILSSVPLNVTVDYGWSWRQYQDLVGIWRACNGDVPTKPKELMARIPEVATSIRTAERRVKELKTAKILIDNTIRKVAEK